MPSSRLWRQRRTLLVLSVVLLLAGAAQAQSWFADVTDQMAWPLLPTGEAVKSFIVGDVNNDGWPDLFQVGAMGTYASYALLLNRQGHQLDQATGQLGLADSSAQAVKGGGSLLGDYDNDGDLDLWVAMGSYGVSLTDRLLRNNRGRFIDVTVQAGVDWPRPTDNATWLDYDRDGHLDRYAGHWLHSYFRSDAVAPGADLHNGLYRNNGDGTFTEASQETGLAVPYYPETPPTHRGGSAQGMVAGDLDNNGWPDLFVGVFEQPNRVYLSDGRGGFSDATSGDLLEGGGTDTQTIGVAAGDIDNDGDLDLFRAAGGQPTAAVAFRSQLLLNLGEGIFMDVTESKGLEGLSLLTTAGPNLADLDNDGDLDLVLANSREPIPDRYTSRLFLNDGTGTFSDGTDHFAVTPAWDNALLDFDRDGDLDILVPYAASGSQGGVRRSHAFFKNTGNSNHWLQVELVGTRSNRMGVGAQVLASSGTLRQVRSLLGGTGWAMHEPIVHLGLETHSQVDRLEVRWPSGEIDVLTDVPADQRIRVIEGQGRYHPAVPATWPEPPVTDSLTAGAAALIQAVVRPSLFEEDSRITSVAADLSELGGPEAVPLEPLGDGAWRITGTLQAPDAPGYRTVAVMVDQTTSLGAYWTRMTRQFTVLPAEDLTIYRDALDQGWVALSKLKVTVNTQADLPVYEGTSSLAAQTSGLWEIALSSSERPQRLGYISLRFAFHPGDAIGDGLNVTLSSSRRTLWPITPGQISVDLSNKSWQIVEIPLDDLHPEQLIGTITFTGKLAGTFYLDDIRLVATRPSSQPGTAVTETRNAALPQAFSLAQNYPNPFNRSTSIRFSLPQPGEVDLAVYNLAGQRVAVLAHGVREAGSYALNWDGRDDAGRVLASGVYLYRLRAGAREETRKVVVVR